MISSYCKNIRNKVTQEHCKVLLVSILFHASKVELRILIDHDKPFSVALQTICNSPNIELEQASNVLNV